MAAAAQGVGRCGGKTRFTKAAGGATRSLSRSLTRQCSSVCRKIRVRGAEIFVGGCKKRVLRARLSSRQESSPGQVIVFVLFFFFAHCAKDSINEIYISINAERGEGLSFKSQRGYCTRAR